MSALYRRLRPLTFQEVVGQEHVKEPLERAIREGRLAQAYLFSGPRGVGKTTTARLLAMAVGCQGAPSLGEDRAVRPCGVCPHCQAVQKGTHPDVVEIDAASNNSVEDVRELREKILLAPISAPKKVFILDEAHMLSKSAFNALLKTLEEPPPHVLFIFATTEPERMPPTILSRTQHYRFRRLTEEEIAHKLRRILKELNREAEEEALLLLARLADGALRDAESLLDRLLLLEGPLTRQKVEEALGLPPQEALFRLAQGLARGDVKAVLSEARGLYARGFAPRSLVGGLMEVLREALYAAHGLPLGYPGELPATSSSLEDSPLGEHHREALLKALAILDEALERLSKRSDLLALEAALLRASRAFLTMAAPGAASPSGEHRAPEEAWAGLPRSHLEGVAEAKENKGPEGASPLGEHRAASPLGEHREDLAGKWRAFLEALRPTLRAFLREAQPSLEGERLVLRFPETKAFHQKRAEEQRATLLPLVRVHFGVEDVAFLLEKKSLAPKPSKPPSPPGDPGPPSGEHRAAGEKPIPNRETERFQVSEPSPLALSAGEDEGFEVLPPASPLGEHRGERLGDISDPSGHLAHLARLLGARLLWLRKPKASELEEPMSEDGIGGSGI